jgi:hypothetical protein
MSDFKVDYDNHPTYQVGKPKRGVRLCVRVFIPTCIVRVWLGLWLFSIRQFVCLCFECVPNLKVDMDKFAPTGAQA